MMNWTPENRSLLNKVLATESPHKTAVFDADGTLWPDDLGEAFFKYQIKNGLAPGIKNISDPWRHYVEMDRDKGTAAASGWLAQICSGVPEDVLKSQCEDFYKKHFSGKIHKPVSDLVG